jgi:hypothetical protein
MKKYKQTRSSIITHQVARVRFECFQIEMKTLHVFIELKHFRASRLLHVLKVCQYDFLRRVRKEEAVSTLA